MKKQFITGLILVSVALGACHKKKQTGSSVDTPPANEVIIDAAADMSATGAAYKVDSIAVNGDILSVYVNYSGGCKDHVFELVSNGMYAKSLPPQLTLCLKHKNNEDMCRKLVMQELKFNIKKAQYKGGKTVMIKLSEMSANYSY
jgi:hypothetical protein